MAIFEGSGRGESPSLGRGPRISEVRAVDQLLHDKVMPPWGPLLREAGKVSPKATDGVWKAGRLDGKFAVTLVQSTLAEAAAHTPSGASRHLLQQAGEGERRTLEMCNP